MAICFSGCGPVASLLALNSARKSVMVGDYDHAIAKCEKALISNQGRVPMTLTMNGKKVNIDYFSNLCLAGSYMLKGDYDKSTPYFFKTIEIFPERAWFSYLALAEMNYMKGSLEEAHGFSLKAKDGVLGPMYDELMKKTVYDKDLFRNATLAAEEFYALRLRFKEMQLASETGAHENVVRLADQIIDKKYRVHFGINGEGTVLISVIKGSVGDLAGFIPGDTILEVNGVKVVDELSLLHEANKLINRYGETATFKIKRKGREFDIVTPFVYPEVEQAERLKREASRMLAGTPTPEEQKDTLPPWLKILEPQQKRGVRIVASDTRMRVVLLASDNDAVKRVLVNGQSCAVSEPDNLEREMLPGKVLKYTVEIPAVEGKGTFTVIALDGSGNSTLQEIEVRTEKRAAAPAGTAPGIAPTDALYRYKIAVVIGINKYQTWPSLEYAVNDAQSIRDRLRQLGYDRIFELYDRDATRDGINRLLGDELPGVMGEEDSLLVYFAGHGATEEIKDEGQEGYLVPIDGDMENYRGTGISMSYIHEMVKRYRAKHILLVFDSCYSGLGLKRSGGGQGRAKDGFVATMAKRRTTQIITAGGKDEQAAEGKGHGLFTRTLLDAMSGQTGFEKNGYLMASDMGQYLRKKVGEVSSFQQNPQFGWLAGEGDFILDLGGN